MPVNLNNLMNNSAHVAVPTSEGDINIEYFPNRLTQKVITQFVEFGEMVGATANKETIQAAFRETNTLLVGLIKSWDLMEMETIPYPLDPARLGDLPMWLVNDISQAIMEHSRPNRLAPQRMLNSSH